MKKRPKSGSGWEALPGLMSLHRPACYSLSAHTITRRIEDGVDLLCKLKKRSKRSDTFHWQWCVRCSPTSHICARNWRFLWGDRGAWCASEFEGDNHRRRLKVCETINMLQLNWEKLKSITTDGSRIMTGNKSGVIGYISIEMQKWNADLPMQLHCTIHQQSLCSKVLRWESDTNMVISSVNFIRGPWHEPSLLSTVSGQNWSRIWRYHVSHGCQVAQLG